MELSMANLRHLAASHISTFLDSMGYVAQPTVDNEELRLALLGKAQSICLAEEASHLSFEAGLSVASVSFIYYQFHCISCPKAEPHNAHVCSPFAGYTGTHRHVYLAGIYHR